MGQEVGRVVGRASPASFFIRSSGSSPPALEYLTYKLNEPEGGEVDVVAQVVEPVSESKVLTEYSEDEAMDKIVEMNLDSPYHYAEVRVLGYLARDGTVKLPRSPPEPGTPVYIAGDDLLKKLYFSERGIEVGHLLGRENVKVTFDLNGFRRHVAILAATGAGKSYSTGLMIEKLLDRGATVVVIDPHGDYTKMGVDKEGNPLRDASGRPVFWYERVIVLHTHPEEEISYPYDRKQVVRFTMKLKDVDLGTLLDLAGVQSKWTNIQEAFNNAYKEMKDDEDPSEFVNKVTQHYPGAEKYARRLLNLSILGRETTDVTDYLGPGRLVILDFSGADDSTLDAATRMILEQIFHCRKGRGDKCRYPVFIFIEEAHRVIPAKRSTQSSRIIERIAREGRKFGVFLTVISQRPRSVNQDVLSMCQSFITLRIVNPEDQRTVKNSAEKMSEDLLEDLPSLNVGEAIVTGELVRAPVIMRFSGRRSDEGGRDIDVERTLEEALEELRREEEMDPRNLPEPEEMV